MSVGSARLPPFSGGVIEGFYGVPWSHAQRLDMIGFVADVGMRTFVYAPKDDRYLRRQWRELYTPEALDRLGELVTRSLERDITFTFAASPGLSMRYTSDADFHQLLAKYEQVRGLGVRSFALLLDDIPGRLQHGEDRDRHDSLVETQIALIARLFSALREHDAQTELIVCPTQYWGHGTEEYIVKLGRGIPPQVDLLWTGRAICSAELTTADARFFQESTGHAPLYWDNFPVNDVAMIYELHIGPYLGREPGLGETSRGIIANAMPLAESSKIGLASVAEFLADPNGFEAEAAWERAILRVAGPRDYAAFREFADAVRGSCLCVDDAPRLAEALEGFSFEYGFGDRTAAVRGLAEQGERMLETARALLDDLMANTALQREVRPWAEQYARGARAIATVAELLGTEDALGTGKLGAAGKGLVWAHLREFRDARLRVFGDLLDMFLSDLVGEFDREE